MVLAFLPLCRLPYLLTGIGQPCLKPSVQARTHCRRPGRYCFSSSSFSQAHSTVTTLAWTTVPTPCSFSPLELGSRPPLLPMVSPTVYVRLLLSHVEFLQTCRLVLARSPCHPRLMSMVLCWQSAVFSRPNVSSSSAGSSVCSIDGCGPSAWDHPRDGALSVCLSHGSDE